MKKNAIFWIREDFRIENNPALSFASQNHDNVIASRCCATPKLICSMLFIPPKIIKLTTTMLVMGRSSYTPRINNYYAHN